MRIMQVLFVDLKIRLTVFPNVKTYKSSISEINGGTILSKTINAMMQSYNVVLEFSFVNFFGRGAQYTLSKRLIAP